jgi:hypothetical protein
MLFAYGREQSGGGAKGGLFNTVGNGGDTGVNLVVRGSRIEVDIGEVIFGSVPVVLIEVRAKVWWVKATAPIIFCP